MTFAPRLSGWAKWWAGPSPRVSRIALGVALVAAAFLFVSAPPASAWTTSDFTNLKARYYDWLTGGTSFSTTDPALQGKLRTINTRAETWWNSMDKVDPRDSLWADQMWPASGGLFIQVSYDRLREMALAYKTPCSSGMATRACTETRRCAMTSSAASTGCTTSGFTPGSPNPAATTGTPTR